MDNDNGSMWFGGWVFMKFGGDVKKKEKQQQCEVCKVLKIWKWLIVVCVGCQEPEFLVHMGELVL